GLSFASIFLTWPLSSYHFYKSGPSAWKVLSRSLLVGAGEWILLIPMLIVSVKFAAAEYARNPSDDVMKLSGSAQSAHGIITMMTTQIVLMVGLGCVLMAFVCLAGHVAINRLVLRRK